MDKKIKIVKKDKNTERDFYISDMKEFLKENQENIHFSEHHFRV